MPFCRFASALIRLASTANPSPLDQAHHRCSARRTSLEDLASVIGRSGESGHAGSSRTSNDRARSPSSPSRQNQRYARLQVDLLAQPPLGADAEAIADDQHPDHQLGINRWPAHRRCRRPASLSRSSNNLRARQTCRLIRRNRWSPGMRLSSVEHGKTTAALFAGLPMSHHGKPPPLAASQQTESANSCAETHEPFFNMG